MTDRWELLKYQSRARSLNGAEMALANALEDIYSSGIKDFADVARRLSEQAIVAPASGKTAWDIALLEQELVTLNASLDDAYARNGIGA